MREIYKKLKKKNLCNVKFTSAFHKNKFYITWIYLFPRKKMFKYFFLNAEGNMFSTRQIFADTLPSPATVQSPLLFRTTRVSSLIIYFPKVASLWRNWSSDGSWSVGSALSTDHDERSIKRTCVCVFCVRVCMHGFSNCLLPVSSLIFSLSVSPFPSSIHFSRRTFLTFASFSSDVELLN